jgi:hypothetical protein
MCILLAHIVLLYNNARCENMNQSLVISNRWLMLQTISTSTDLHELLHYSTVASDLVPSLYSKTGTTQNVIRALNSIGAYFYKRIWWCLYSAVTEQPCDPTKCVAHCQ